MIKTTYQCENKTLHRIEFDSFEEFINQAKTGKTDLKQKDRASFRRESGYFSGVKTFDDAITLYREGWQVAEKKVRELSEPLIQDIAHKIIRRDPYYDVEGIQFDVARVINNEPESWIAYRDEITDGPGNHIIHLVFNCSASCGISKETIIARGAVIVSLIELLEYSGHRVRVTLNNTKKRRTTVNLLEEYIDLKKADQPLDLPRLTFALAHPSVLRRFFFSIHEQESPAIRKEFDIGLDLGGGYGQPGDPLKKDQGDIFIGNATYKDTNWRDPKSATNWIVSQLEKLGIKIKTLQGAI